MSDVKQTVVACANVTLLQERTSFDHHTGDVWELMEPITKPICGSPAEDPAGANQKLQALLNTQEDVRNVASLGLQWSHCAVLKHRVKDFVDEHGHQAAVYDVIKLNCGTGVTLEEAKKNWLAGALAYVHKNPYLQYEDSQFQKAASDRQRELEALPKWQYKKEPF